MISACYHQDSVIRSKTIRLIEKVGTCHLGNNGIDIFEDKQTRSYLASLLEDCLDVPGIRCGLDI